MKYLKFTFVDSETGISVAAEPAMHATQFPAVAGLEFVWARESAYPTSVPEMFGTCPDASDTQIDGVLGIFSEADFRQMQADEMALRDTTPKAVTMRQARLALLGSGKLAAVDAAIALLPEPQKSAARIEWEYSGEVKRHNGFVAALGPALGLSEAQIDALFVAASKL